MFLTIAYLLLVCICVLSWKYLPKYEPNKLFVFLWTIQIALGSLFFIGSYQFSGYFFLYVATISLLLFCSSLLSKKVTQKMFVQKNDYDFNPNRAILIIMVSLIPAIVYPFVILRINHINISDLFNSQGLIDVNFRMAELRYSGKLEISKWAQIMLAFIYLLPLFSGFVFKQLPLKKRWFCFLPFIPIMVILLTMNTKVVVIASIMLWLCGWICSAIFSGKPLSKHLGWKKIAIIVSSGIIFIALLAFSMMLRIGDVDTEIAKVVKRKFEIYALGHLPATDKWFYDDKDSLSLFEDHVGKTMFYGVLGPLHIAQREQGVYKKHVTYSYFFTRISDESDKQYRVPEGVEIPDGIDSTIIVIIDGEPYYRHPLHTNVYTVFRPAMEDYGIIGSILFFFLVGFLGSLAFYFVTKRRYVFISTTILGFIFFFYLYYITSVWAYTSYFAAFALFYIAVKISFNKKREHEFIPE